MINENTQRIKAYLGSVIYSRALDYYKYGRVSDIWTEGDFIVGTIYGSDPEPYSASVNPFDGKYRCSCPYGRKCKHVGALLLKSHYEQLTWEPPDLSVPEEIIDEIPLNFESSEKISIGFPSALEVKKTNTLGRGNFKLVFVIDTSCYYYQNSLFITPMIRYIKKDGSPGRVEPYSRDKVSYPLKESESEFFDIISSYSSLRIPLYRALPFILKNIDLEILNSDNNELNRLEFKEINSIELNFRLSSIKENYNTEFIPTFTCIDADDDSIKPFHISVSDMKLVASNNRKILYNVNNHKMISLCETVLTLRNDYSPRDIKKLKSLSESEPEACFFVNFPHNKIKTIKGGAKPVLDLDPDHLSDSTYINLLFDYHGREFPFSRHELLLNLDHLNEAGDSFHIAIRDENYEKKVARYVMTLTGAEIRNKSIPGFLGDYIQVSLVKLPLEEFLSKFGSELISRGISLRLKKTRKKISRTSGKVAFKVKTGIDWFDVETVCKNEDGSETRFDIDEEMLKNRLAKKDDGYMLLSDEDIVRLTALSRTRASGEKGLKIHRLDFSSLEAISDAVDDEDREAVDKTLKTYRKLKDIKGIKSCEIPGGFNGTLRNYQQEGYNWLCFLREIGLNGCLADDMGLGKTVQTLALLQRLKENNTLRPALLVVPVSTIPNWEQEILRFTPSISSLRHTGQHRSGDENEILNHDVIITSYHTLRNDIEFISKIDFSCLVLDEAQNIKNAESKAFKAVKKIKAAQITALSGTPVENKTGELWALFDVLNPGLLGTKQRFRSEFARPIENDRSPIAAEKLRALIFPFILRRKKEMVAAELPPKEEITVYCEMGDKQRTVYNTFKERYRIIIQEILEKKGKNNAAIEIFDSLMKLRQIALFPSLLTDHLEKNESCKFDLLKDMIDEILVEGHNLLIFSQFVKSLKIIENYLIESNLNYSYIDGSTKDRDAEIKKFQNNDNVNIFLLSLKAGGTGINLTEADYVLLFDPWWNPAVESQAIDRAHRIGQTKKVTAYKLIVKDTVEEKILSLQQKKKAIVNDLITEEASFFKSLSGDDIVDLFT